MPRVNVTTTNSRLQGTAITSVTSETHAAGLTVGPAPPRARDDSAPAAAGDDCRSRLVTLRQGTPVLDADIVIKIATASPHQPRCIVETLPNGSRAAVLTLAPKIELDSERAEIVFVVDCSGSMSGWNMRQASRAMQLFLRSLPVDCFVNIVRFGSRYTSLWPSPRKYTASTMAEAARYIEGMQADLGGTAMQAPLAHVLGQPAVQGYSRQVFVCGNFDIILDHFSRISQLHPHPICAVVYALFGSHADRVVIGACNPML